MVVIINKTLRINIFQTQRINIFLWSADDALVAFFFIIIIGFYRHLCILSLKTTTLSIYFPIFF